MVLGRGSRLFGRLRSFCDPVLSGWNISTRLSIPDKDGGGTTPVSPAVIRTDRSDVSGGEGTFPVNDGTTEEPGHRLLFRDCPRRSRYYLVDFSYVLLSSTNLSQRYWKRFWGTNGGASVIDNLGFVTRNFKLHPLNWTPSVSRELARVLIPKSLARKKRLLRELGKVKFWMSNEICDIKITVFDALLSAIKSHTSQRIKKIRRIARKSLQRDIMDNLSSNFLNVKWKLMINFQKFPTKIIFSIARICSIPQHLPSRYHRNIKERKKEIYKMKNVMAELDEVRPFYS